MTCIAPYIPSAHASAHAQH